MGHAAKVDDTDSPSHQQQAVLTCPSRPGGRLACANVWRISFRRGESYGGAWAFTVGKKRKEEEKHSINNTAGWNISANVRFVLRSKHDAYVPPSISADHQVKYVHLTLTHVCLRSCICKGLKPNQLCSHWHESPPAAACYGGWQKTPGVIMAVTWPVRPVLKIRSRFIGSRGYRWSTDRLVKQPAHLYTQLKAQDWKTRMNELSPALEKLLTQQTSTCPSAQHGNNDALHPVSSCLPRQPLQTSALTPSQKTNLIQRHKITFSGLYSNFWLIPSAIMKTRD